MLLNPADESGCGSFRIINPAATLKDTIGLQCVKSFHYLSNEQLLEYGITKVITQRQSEPAQVIELNRYKQFGLEMINDLDDLLWNVPASNSFSKTFKSENKAALLKTIQAADTNTVSTEPLQHLLKAWSGKDSIIVPNMLLPQYYTQTLRERSTDKLQVFWAGSPTHGGDLKLLSQIIELTKDYADFTLMGYLPNSLKGKVSFIEGVDFQFYHSTLLKLKFDLTIAPLEQHPFNECKSNLKLLEFGAVGVPVITNDIVPYQNNPSIKIGYKNQVNNWVDAIIMFAQDEEMRKNHAKLCFDYAKTFESTLSNNVEIVKTAWGV